MLEFEFENNHLEAHIAELNKELVGAQKIACIHERAVRLIEISRAIRIAAKELRLLNQSKRAALKASQEKISASREIMRESRKILKESAVQEIAA